MSIYDIAAEYDVSLERFQCKSPYYHVCYDDKTIGEVGREGKGRTNWYASVYDGDGDCQDGEEGLTRREAIEFVTCWWPNYWARQVELPAADDTIGEAWVGRLFSSIQRIVSNPKVCKASKDFDRLRQLVELVDGGSSIETASQSGESEAV